VFLTERGSLRKKQRLCTGSRTSSIQSERQEAQTGEAQGFVLNCGWFDDFGVCFFIYLVLGHCEQEMG